MAVSAGDYHGCALLGDGAARCWGRNGHGQLGAGEVTPFPPGGVATAVEVAGLVRARALGAGSDHTCALLAGGEVRCWGANDSGQLGIEGAADALAPVAVQDIRTATALAVGPLHACALLADGTVRCWGDNSYGQLGDGSAGNVRSSPVAVGGLIDAVEIALGFGRSCARLADGTARCWRLNQDGQLGDGSTAPRRTPVPVVSFP